MIVTIIAETATPTMPDTATRLARRRALAGRNVLLLKQNCERKQANQYTKDHNNAGWSRMEMKAGARSRALSSELMMRELASTDDVFHDVIIDVPKPFYADAKTVLASSNLLVFHMELNLWDKEREAKLYKCIRLARNTNMDLPVLVIIDKIDCMQSQKFVSQLSGNLAHIKFIYLDDANDMSLANLYRAIYLP
ncbi:hypothetical protein [Undibacterium sp. TS12]|uniref:hypothetical protein n=1 Tax=Undibacterium sp. TS12 TaxID=2908202 RepID=UPI001F4C5638|nr:hypothetical protein [Undibacterium sp. TS12]MCH8621468.1 hypothetical protein [Undibacterium sp. TS12]